MNGSGLLHMDPSYDFFHRAPHLDVAAAALDIHMKVIYANARFNELYGMSSREPEQLQEGSMLYKQIKDNAYMNRGGVFLEESVHGKVSYWALHYYWDRLPLDPVCHLVLCDISALYKAYEANLEHERMVVTGRMAAETANSILNPLAVVKGSLQLLYETVNKRLKSSLITDDNIRQYMKMAEGQINVIEQTIRRFLLFGNPIELKVQCVGLSDFLQMFVPGAQKNAMRHEVVLVCEYPHRDCQILIHPPSLSQVIDELLQNAFEASPDKGVVKLVVQVQDQNVQFTIVDNGRGIPEEDMKRAKCAFFSTKEDSLGMGLTLSEILTKQMGGTLTLQSSYEGSQVMVTLPVLE